MKNSNEKKKDKKWERGKQKVSNKKRSSKTKLCQMPLEMMSYQFRCNLDHNLRSWILRELCHLKIPNVKNYERGYNDGYCKFGQIEITLLEMSVADNLLTKFYRSFFLLLCKHLLPWASTG